MEHKEKDIFIYIPLCVQLYKQYDIVENYFVHDTLFFTANYTSSV